MNMVVLILIGLAVIIGTFGLAYVLDKRAAKNNNMNLKDYIFNEEENNE